MSVIRITVGSYVSYKNYSRIICQLLKYCISNLKVMLNNVDNEIEKNKK